MKPHPSTDPRGNIRLVPHHIVTESLATFRGHALNVIFEGNNPDLQWAYRATAQIGEWRSRMRSIYLQWALAINGLHLAAERYGDPRNADRLPFYVHSLRRPRGELPRREVIHVFGDSDVLVDANLNSVPKLAAWGIADLYSNFEDVIFELYRLYLHNHPDTLLTGDEQRESRRLRRAMDSGTLDADAWGAHLAQRIAAWEAKQRRSSLGRVMLSFFDTAQLKAHARYVTGHKEWAGTLTLIAEVRNSLVHGALAVSDRLAALSATPYNAGMVFRAGEPLALTTFHLQCVELFFDQMLTAINLSIVQKCETVTLRDLLRQEQQEAVAPSANGLEP